MQVWYCCLFLWFPRLCLLPPLSCQQGAHFPRANHSHCIKAVSPLDLASCQMSKADLQVKEKQIAVTVFCACRIKGCHQKYKWNEVIYSLALHRKSVCVGDKVILLCYCFSNMHRSLHICSGNLGNTDHMQTLLTPETYDTTSQRVQLSQNFTWNSTVMLLLSEVAVISLLNSCNVTQKTKNKDTVLFCSCKQQRQSELDAPSVCCFFCFF